MGMRGIVPLVKLKMNPKTVEVADMGNTSFGRTVTRVPRMIIGKVAA